MTPNEDEPLEQGDLVRFLPEGAIAAIAVIFAPVWAIMLGIKGHIVIGIVWWIGAWSLGYVAYWSYKKGDRGGIFIAIGGTAVLVLLINKWTH